MDLDSLLKLQDAQIRSAESEADTAGKWGDALQKWAQAEVTEQAAFKAWLQNKSLAQNIGWDADAHAQFERQKSLKLQEAALLRKKRAQWAEKIAHAGWLLRGENSLDSIQAAWIGFEFLRSSLGFAASMKAATVMPQPDAYKRDNWLHPEGRIPASLSVHDPGSLLGWARTRNLYPRLGTAAAQYLMDMFGSMADAAGAEAARIDKETSEKEAAGLELEKFDWARLNRPAGIT